MQFASLIPRYLFALMLTISAYGIYGKFIAPRIEGKPNIVKATPAILIEHRPASEIKKELVGLFPADGWEWQPCTILETKQARVLFQDHTILEDGSIELKQLSMVLNSTERIVDGKVVKTPPVVLRAPEGARLKFENGLTADGDLGELEYGQLMGEVQVFRPASDPTRDDSLTMVTENVQISPERIFTLYECEFRFGQSYGRGKHLTVDLTGPDGDSDDKTTFSGVQRIELAKVHELYLHREKKTRLHAPGARPDQADLLGDTQRSFLISSEGPMVFDFDSGTAWFEDQVFVRPANGNGEQLTCHKLTVFFSRTGDSKASSKIDEYRIRRLLAEGKDHLPAVITSVARNAQIAASTIDYDLAGNSVTLKSTKQVALTRNGQDILAREIRYSFTQDGRLGNAVMLGPGSIKQIAGEKDRRGTLVCQWNDKLTLQDDDQKKVLSLDGARISMTDTVISANQLHLWMWEVPEPGPRGNQRWRFEPAKMFADGQVQIEASEISGECREAAAFWPEPLDRVVARKPGTPFRQESGSPGQALTQTRTHGQWQQQPVQSASSHLSWQSQSRRSGRQTEWRSSPQAVLPVTFLEPAPTQSTRFRGIQVQLQMRGGKQRGEVNELTVDGDVVVRQQQHRSNGSSETILEIRGDKLRIMNQSRDRHRLFVAGNQTTPASLSMNELVLTGPAIHLDQAANRLWIEGAGHMLLDATRVLDIGNPSAVPAHNTSNTLTRSPVSSGVTDVDWEGGMVFDGQMIYFETGVKSRSQQTDRTDQSITTTATRSAALSISLNQRVDFGQIESPSRPDNMEVDNLVVVGSMQSADVAFPDTFRPAADPRVQVATGKFNAAGEIISSQEIVAPRVTFDTRSGLVDCKGPGTVIARQLASARPNGNGVAIPLGSAGQRKGDVDFIKVDFDSAFHGNMESRQLKFTGNVHSFYAETTRWDTLVDESAIRQPENSGFIMDCDELVMAQWTPDASAPTIEMIATGNVRVAGSRFDATAERVSYLQSSGQVIIEAPTRSNAELWFQQPGQASRGHLVAKTVTYNLNTGEYEGQEIKQIHYSQEGPLRGKR